MDELDRLPQLTPSDELDLPPTEHRPRMLHTGCLRIFIGPILILAGLYALLMWLGLSTWIDPKLPSTEWWAEWVRRAFAPSDLLPALVLGLGMVGLGCWLIIRNIRRIG